MGARLHHHEDAPPQYFQGSNPEDKRLCGGHANVHVIKVVGRVILDPMTHIGNREHPSGDRNQREYAQKYRMNGIHHGIWPVFASEALQESVDEFVKNVEGDAESQKEEEGAKHQGDDIMLHDDYID